MTEIQGLEGIAGAVTEIALLNGEAPEQNEMKITLVTDDGEADITEAVLNAGNDFDGDDTNDDLNDNRTVAHLPGSNGELFDSGTYVDLPVIDGQATDKLVIAFGGSIKYDASDRAGQDLFNALRLGKSVTLRIEGVVADKKGGYKVNARDEEVVTGTARIKIETLYLPSPSEL